jgi:hypothetical protein
MESESTLVRTQGRVELHSVASVHTQLATVVLPSDTELQDTLGNGDDLESGAVLGVFLEEGAVFEGAGQLCWYIKLIYIHVYMICGYLI